MSLKYLDNFKELFLESYNDFLDSNMFQHILKIDNINNIPNLILNGSDSMILNLCLKLFYTKILKSDINAVKTSPNNTHNFPHFWHSKYIIIDFLECLSQDKLNILSFLKNITQQNTFSIDDKEIKQVIILKNIHTLSGSFLIRLKKIFESNVLFICTTKNLSNIDSYIKSRFCIIRCTINVFKKCDIITNRLHLNLSTERLEFYLNKSEGNISKFLLLLINNKDQLIIDLFLKEKINLLIDCYKNTKEFNKQLSDICNKLELSNITYNSILHNLVYICCNNYKQCDIHEIINIVSEIQYKFHHSNKLTFVYEELIMRIICSLIKCK
jgi:hypothetical protein